MIALQSILIFAVLPALVAALGVIIFKIQISTK